MEGKRILMTSLFDPARFSGCLIRREFPRDKYLYAATLGWKWKRLAAPLTLQENQTRSAIR